MSERPSLPANEMGRQQAKPEGESQPTGLAGGRIPVYPDHTSAPLSFGQERLWFLNRLEIGNPAYNLTQAVRLQGHLQIEALAAALTEVLRRHESLRTVFVEVDGRPVQRVSPARAFVVSLADLSPLPEEAREAEAHRLTEAEARQPFDLAAGPLMRASLLRLAAADHLLLLSMHHVVSDHWSSGILAREVSGAYAAHIRGAATSLPSLPIQYADYAAWQREWLRDEVLEGHLAYWRQQLAGLSPSLDLPTDHPAPPRAFAPGAQRTAFLPRDQVLAIKALSSRERVTPFMTLLAAFQVLLGRYAGVEDVVVGTPVAGRPRVELEDLIGFFVNTLALRADLRGDPTFRELLRRTRETVFDAFDHQDLPFERLVEELRPPRDSGRTPLIQVMFALQNAPRTDWSLPDLTVQRRLVENGVAKFDLSLSLREEPDGLRMTMEYDRDLFAEPTIDRLLGHYRTLLEGVVARPESRIASLPLLNAEERHQVLGVWNDTARPYPRHATVHQLFEAQVERAPDQVAIIDGEERLTYRELNRRANRLAWVLRQRGVRPDTPVGLCLERGAALAVAALGILKAGGAYVPLDPRDPGERLAFLLADTEARLVVTEAATRSRLPAGEAEVVCLDQEETLREASEENGESAAGADHLAYIMYTSGSTGTPKGVAVSHRAIVRLVINTDYVQVGPADVMAQVSHPSFDACTFELWGALLNGARLVVLPRDTILTPQLLGQDLRAHGVTILFLTAALFNQVIRDAPEALQPVQNVLVGGDRFDADFGRTALARGRPRRLLNAYGPTEGTTFSTWHLIEEIPDDVTTVPIGRPVANTRAYILDQNLQPVPMGVAGELYVGGDGVARGYHRRPELTAASFVPDPFATDPTARLYRTGDRARYRPDGAIEFLGRRDEQVKVRGFRVEPGEIESVLRQHAAVRDAAVVARGDESGEQRLVAYVVLSEEDAGRESLSAHLKQRLPAYLVPASFVLLPDLPLTSNGKVDRRALPAPDQVAIESSEAFVPPRDMTEERLAALWEETLNVRPIGVRDDFFALGGHSLLAVRLFARIRREFGKELPLAILFAGATIEHLAERLRRAENSAAQSLLMPIQAGGARLPFYCVHVASGNLLAYRDLARYLGPHQPFYGIQDVRPSEGQHLGIVEMASRYVQAIRHHQPVGPYHLGGFCFGGIVAFEMACQLREQGEEVGLLAILDAARPGSVRLLPLHQRVLHHASSLLRLPHRERLDYLRARMDHVRRKVARVRRGVASRLFGLVSRPEMTQVREAEMASWHAFRRYTTRPYDGRITIFQAESEVPWYCAQDPRAAWGDVAKRGLEVYSVPGSHWAILKEPHVRVLAQQLAACLARASTASTVVPGVAASDPIDGETL